MNENRIPASEPQPSFSMLHLNIYIAVLGVCNRKNDRLLFYGITAQMRWSAGELCGDAVNISEAKSSLYAGKTLDKLPVFARNPSGDFGCFRIRESIIPKIVHIEP